LKTAIENLQKSNYKVEFTNTISSGDVLNEGIYTIDRNKKAVLKDYAKTEDSDRKVLVDIIVDTYVTSAFITEPESVSSPVVYNNKVSLQTEEGETMGSLKDFIPTISFSSDLFDKGENDVYTLDPIGLEDGLTSTFDLFTGYGDTDTAENSGLEISLGTDENISSFTYNYSQGEFNFGTVKAVVTEVNSAAIPYDLSSVRNPKNWVEEGLNNTLVFESLKTYYPTYFQYIPYLFGRADETGDDWEGYLDPTGAIDSVNQYYSLTCYLGDGSKSLTLNDYKTLLNPSSLFTKDSKYVTSNETPYLKYDGTSAVGFSIYVYVGSSELPASQDTVSIYISNPKVD